MSEQLAVSETSAAPAAAAVEPLPECLQDPAVVEKVNAITSDQLRESLE